MRRLDVIVFLVVLDVVLAIILVYRPIELTTVLTKPYLLGTASAYLLILVMFNIGDFIACSVFFVLMVAVLAHRLVWPILERPIYALHRYGVIRRKRLLWTVAIALLVGPNTFVALIKYIVQHV